jgi:hypothetical protein
MVTNSKPQIERKKLSIISVEPLKHWGDKNLPILKFKASDESGKELSYEIFANQSLIDACPQTGILDCDVETSSRIKEDQTYTDRKIKQIYVNGEPIDVKKKGGWQGRSPEERLSIERQTCLRCACDILPPGMSGVDDILITAEKMLQWVRNGTIPCKEVKEIKTADEDFNKLGRTEEEKKRQFPNVGALLTAAMKERHMTRQEVYDKLGVAKGEDITDFSGAWEKLK